MSLSDVSSPKTLALGRWDLGMEVPVASPSTRWTQGAGQPAWSGRPQESRQIKGAHLLCCQVTLGMHTMEGGSQIQLKVRN